MDQIGLENGTPLNAAKLAERAQELLSQQETK
jgi:hypothetical protein